MTLDEELCRLLRRKRCTRLLKILRTPLSRSDFSPAGRPPRALARIIDIEAISELRVILTCAPMGSYFPRAHIEAILTDYELSRLVEAGVLTLAGDIVFLTRRPAG